MNSEIGCALAGAAALGAVIVISTNAGGKRMFAPRGGQCASAMRTTTSNNPQTDKGAATCSGGGGLIDGFNAPTLFDPPSLQTPVNAQAGMTAQRRTLTEMVTAQLDSSLNTKLTGHSVLLAGTPPTTPQRRTAPTSRLRCGLCRRWTPTRPRAEDQKKKNAASAERLCLHAVHGCVANLQAEEATRAGACATAEEGRQRAQPVFAAARPLRRW